MKWIRALVWMGLVCLLVAPAVQAQQQRKGESDQPKQVRGVLDAEPQAPRRTEQGPAGASAVPRLMKLSGVVRDGTGEPRTGAVGLRFAVYAEQEGGAALWMETQNVELDQQGRYSVLLGTTRLEGLPLELFTAAEPRWLGVEVALPGEMEQPRALLVSVPYALRAADAETLGGKPLSAFVLAESPVGPGSTSGGSATTRKTAQAAAGTATDPSGDPDPAVHGTGTLNFIPVWLDVSTIGNSVLFQSSGNVGVGTTTPGQRLDVSGNINASGNLSAATGSFGAVTATGNIAAASFSLPATSGPTVGVMTLGGSRFIHGFGTFNTFVGAAAGNFSMTGNSNTATGVFALTANTTGNGNTASGFEALLNNTTGSENTAGGQGALLSNTTGSFNTATGSNALLSNTSGSGNTAIGDQALLDNTTGIANTASGLTALANNTTGSDNTASGFNALRNNTTGSGNTAIGRGAGLTATPANANTTGSENTFIGRNAGPGTSSQLTNATAIGANALVSANNALVLGDSAVKVGIGTQTPATRLHVAGGDMHTSDAGAGLIVKSPDGTKCARIGIDNTGAIAVTSVTCP